MPLEKSHDKVSREAPWYCIGTAGVAEEGRNSIEKAWELIRIDKNLAVHGMEITNQLDSLLILVVFALAPL